MVQRRLTARVRLLDDPCLWCWEIQDNMDGRLIASSWAMDWMAFSSREEAEAAAARRLAELERAPVGRRAGHRSGGGRPGFSRAS